VGWPQWRFDRYLDPAKQERMAQAGLRLLDADGGLDLLARALGSGRPAVGAVLGGAEAVDAVLAEHEAPAHDPLEALSDDDLAAYVAHLRAVAVGPEPVPLPVLPMRGAAALCADIRGIVAGHLRIAENRIGDDTCLTDLGLDSIKALHIANKLAARTGLGVEPAMLYRHPTPAGLAAALTEAAH
jgi:aryl carrier-like protein